MDIALILAGIFILGILVQYLKQKAIKTNSKKSNKRSNKNYSYSKSYKGVNSLLTKAELNFYNTLEPVCGELNFTLFAKVRMWDLVNIVSKDNYLTCRNKVQSKHIDFVLCDARTLKPIVCIELDDKSHNREDRIARDKFVDEVLISSGYKMLHIPCAYTYSKRIIKNKIQKAVLKSKAS